MAQLPAKLDAIPAVDIDTGRFKYVLIRVDMQNAETKEEHSKVIVRGYTWAAFHGKRDTSFITNEIRPSHYRRGAVAERYEDQRCIWSLLHFGVSS